MADVVKRQENDVENHELTDFRHQSCNQLLVKYGWFQVRLSNTKSYFMAVWQNSQNYAHRYLGQVIALLPNASWPRATVHSRGHKCDYLPNRHEITG